jgi:hypothetical protein
MLEVEDSNSENKPKIGANPGIIRTNSIGRSEQSWDWFSAYLKYQAQNSAFFEYLIREDENGRQ